MSLKRSYSETVRPGSEDETSYPPPKIFIPERKVPEGEEEEVKTPIANPEEYDTTFDDYKRALQALDVGDFDDCECQYESGGKDLPQYLWNSKTGCRNGATSNLFTTVHGLGCCRSEKYPEAVHGEFLVRINRLVFTHD